MLGTGTTDAGLPLARFFAYTLRAYGDRPAVITPDGSSITYRELSARVSMIEECLGATRRLVLVSAANTVAALATYLAGLRGGHPVLLASGSDDRRLNALVSRYDPDVVVRCTEEEWQLHERRAGGTAHSLHPELALLLSTSGTTGSAKLVRLCATNLQANAEAIADYLDVRDTDCAVVSLPIHYSYGLSIINSNLLRGATLLLSGSSVIDASFWSAFHRHRATSLHGVPYTFDLLDRIGFERMTLPSLRYVTQAGGRLAPERVRRYAQLAERAGWRLFVMYGQTEATARMAYLPPELAASHPGAIGIPIPGGSFEIRSSGSPDEGELIYRGPNVMLGYARGPADLALGRTVDALATGDIGRRTPDGLYEVTGRRKRFIKLFGHRIDLDQVEHLLQGSGHVTACTGSDDALIIAVAGDDDVHQVRELVAVRLGLAPSRVRVHRFDELPRLPNGKIDYPAVERHARDTPIPVPSPLAPRFHQSAPETRTSTGGAQRNASHRLWPSWKRDRSVRAIFAKALNHPGIADNDTFVGLGGDSLTYVEVSIALEEVLGDVPDAWPTMSVRELEEVRPTTRALASAETAIPLRAVAIMLVVGTHITAFHLPGGAHLLLVLSGWSFARFTLASGEPDRTSRLLRSAAGLAIPTMLWLVWRATVTDEVGLANVLLLNNYLHQNVAIGYWYVEVLVQILLVLAAAFAIPAVRRYEQRHSFACAAIALVATLLAAQLFSNDAPGFPERVMSTHKVAWFFALGWLARQSGPGNRRLLAVGSALMFIPGFFNQPDREAIILAGVLLLILLPRVRLPRRAARTAGTIAGASLWIYLTHWAVFPPLLSYLPPVVVFLVSLAAGVVSWSIVRCCSTAYRRVAAHARRASRFTPRPSSSTSTSTSSSTSQSLHRNAAAV